MSAKERVQEEIAALEDKISRLATFMTEGTFQDLEDEMQFLLEMQLDAMTMYYDILRKRLKIWQD